MQPHLEAWDAGHAGRNGHATGNGNGHRHNGDVEAAR
jgi:hypothetical protein